MEMTVIFWLFGTVIAFTVIAIVFITTKAKWRASRMAQVAQRWNLTYQRAGSESLTSELGELPLFTLAAFGSRATISNVITGKIDGSSLTALDYAYWTGSAETRRFDYAQTVVCFHLPPTPYPRFTLYPKGGARRASIALAGALAKPLTAVAKPLSGGDERWSAVETILESESEGGIDLPAHTQLSQRYTLQGSDPAAIRRMFGRHFVESLLDFESHPLSVESGGRWLAIYRKNKLIAPEKLADFLKHCMRLQKNLSAQTA